MKYFISYIYYDNGKPFFGNAEWEGAALTCLDHIESIEEEIANQFENKVFVKLLFWRSFDTA